MTMPRVILETREDAAAWAQIAFLNQTSWSVRGGYVSHSGLFERAPMPILPPGLPIVNLTNLHDDPRVLSTLRRHIQPAGIRDVPALVEILSGYGARVLYST